jgi:hypothetical protein
MYVCICAFGEIYVLDTGEYAHLLTIFICGGHAQSFSLSASYARGDECVRLYSRMLCHNPTQQEYLKPFKAMYAHVFTRLASPSAGRPWTSYLCLCDGTRVPFPMAGHMTCVKDTQLLAYICSTVPLGRQLCLWRPQPPCGAPRVFR